MHTCRLQVILFMFLRVFCFVVLGYVSIIEAYAFCERPESVTPGCIRTETSTYKYPIDTCTVYCNTSLCNDVSRVPQEFGPPRD